MNNSEHHRFWIRCTYLALLAGIYLVTDTNTHTWKKSFLVNEFEFNTNTYTLNIAGNSKCSCSRAHGTVTRITLWHKIITYEKLFWNNYFWKKLRISRVIPWKCLSFPDISRAQNPSKIITKNNSQGIIFRNNFVSEGLQLHELMVLEFQM